MPYYPPASAGGSFLPLAGGTMSGTITSTMGTITANTPALSATQTWNNAAVTFNGIFLNILANASAGGSRLLKIQQNSTDVLTLNAAGEFIVSGNGCGLQFAPRTFGGSPYQWYAVTSAAARLYSGSADVVAFTSDGVIDIKGAGDTGLGRNAAGVAEINSTVAGTFRDMKLREIFATGAIRSGSPTGGLGYSTGAGGTVTQATSKATGVTLNTVTGQITMAAAALAAGAIVSFTLTNSAIAAGDILLLNHISGGTPGPYLLNAQTVEGSATINVRNTSAGSLSQAIVIAFAVIKGVTA